MTLKRSVKWLAIGCGFFAACISGIIFFVFDTENRPVCHKALYFMIVSWQESHQRTRLFPNVDGEQVASMAALNVERELSGWGSHYSYIPGLSEDDPKDLVLFYINQPTRWTDRKSTRLNSSH